MRPSMSSRERPPSMMSDKMKAIFYWATAVLSAAALVIAVIKCFAATSLEWPETALLAAAVAGTLATLARQLPLLHAVSVTVLITVIGLTANWPCFQRQNWTAVRAIYYCRESRRKIV